MISSYKIAEVAIIVEFSLVLTILVATILSKIVDAIYNRNVKRISNEINGYLAKINLYNHKFNPQDVKKRWLRLDILLQSIEDFDNTPSTGHWHAIRTEFIKTIVLPLAKIDAKHRRLDYRVNAARAFSLIKQDGNDEIINQLITSNIPLIYLYAIMAAVLNHAEKAIDTMVRKMANEPWASQSIYLQAFDNLPTDDRTYFEQKLMATTDPNLRAVYYKLLIRFKTKQVSWGVSHDIESSNTELKISAIKFISEVDRDIAIPLLIRMLDDPSWELRLISIRRLNMLHAEQEIPEISERLKDSDWWVRASVEEAMKQIKK